MKRLATFAAAAALCAATLAPAPAAALGDNERAALAALLILGVAAAAARHGDNHDSLSDWDEDRYGEPFSPSDGIVCLPRPRQCYDHGRLSHRWTRRIFGS
jgi:hypothetical protein